MFIKLYNILTSPWIILLSMILGILLYIFLKPIVPLLAPLGTTYINLLSMTVIPVMISAVSLSLGRLLRCSNLRSELAKIFFAFAATLLLTAVVGVVIGIIGQPGKLANETRENIGKIVLKSEASDNNFFEKRSIANIPDFIIPTNIFFSLNNGEILKILFFFIILSITFNFLPETSCELFFNLLEGIFLAFQAIIKFFLFFLPFALCSLISNQLLLLGPAIFISLFKFIIIFLLSVIVIISIYAAIFSVIYKKNIFYAAIMLKKSLIIAFGTRNSVATIPIVADELHDKLGLQKDKVNLFFPLGVALCHYSSVLIFSLATIFSLQLYGFSISIVTVLIVVFMSFIASFSTIGVPGVVSYSMISLVFMPLNLPLNIIVIILIALDQVFDPFATILNVYLNGVITAIMAKSKKVICEK